MVLAFKFSVSGGGAESAEPGTVESLLLPHMDKAVRASENIKINEGEFLIMYFREDGNYDNWNLWLWNEKQGGTKYLFSGVEKGLAYHIGRRDRFFDENKRILNLIVRTDAWEKDPGPDQYYCLDNGPRFVVFSGEKTVFPVGKAKPLILHTELHETKSGEFLLRLVLSSKYALPLKKAAGGFYLDNGLIVSDVFNYENREGRENRKNNFTSGILAAFSGKIDYGRQYTIAHPVFGKGLPVRFPEPPKAAPELTAEIKALLPEPVLEGRSDWIELYWAAWKFLYEKITPGNTANGFAEKYLDEGFNENIYQWDSCFMAAYAIYGPEVFPAMATLDNFYSRQRKSDGYICRCYNQDTGLMTGENDINPTLFAWMEWRYYKVSGDESRIQRVLPVLDSYFEWCKKNARSDYGSGLYFITDLGSGMDNSPRESFIGKGAWIDLSSQQALAALYISKLAGAVNDGVLRKKYEKENTELKNRINEYLWNREEGSYYDKKEDGSWHIRNTIASFWPLTAEIADSEKAARMIDGYLKNPKHFYRKHLFPALSASDEDYNSTGHYWRGGVWAPTNFAVIKGISLYDRAFARLASVNHIENMSRVYHGFNPADYVFAMPGLTEKNIARNGEGLKQIWEAYAPDFEAPATRWDKTLLVRQKFCGWSGLGPVALLIEEVLGIDIDAPFNRILWNIRSDKRQGLKNFKMGKNKISLISAAEDKEGGALIIEGSASEPFNLTVTYYDREEPLFSGAIEKAGEFRLNLKTK